LSQERNFLREQTGMHVQLQTLYQLVQFLDPQLYLHFEQAECTNVFFFFRMMLVWFKREFEWLDIQRLWEVLWTDLYSGNFHLFIALAILEKHRHVIMNQLPHFDDILKYINELSTNIDLESTLVGAERLFRRFERTIEAFDRKDSFPPPSSARQRILGSASTSSAQDTRPSRATPALLNSPTTPESSSAQRAGDTAASTTGAEPSSVSEGKKKSEDEPARPAGQDAALLAKVISPELRGLLSREPSKPKKKQKKKKKTLAVLGQTCGVS
jgi:hypothetical protein